MKKAESARIATTAQSLGSLLKSGRDIMRKDKGLNGDLDRLPMLTWIMSLKMLDDLELQRAEEAKLAGPRRSTPHPGPLPGRGGELDALKRLQAATAAELDALLPAILDRASRPRLQRRFVILTTPDSKWTTSRPSRRSLKM